MKKFLKPGRVVILLSGKHAGKKAVIVKVFYEGSKDRKFGHCLVAGMARYPRRVTKKMSDKKVSQRIRIKPFVKYVNFNHFIPTRYMMNQEVDVKGVLRSFDNQSSMKKDGEVVDGLRDPLNNVDFKVKLRKKVKDMLEERYRKVDLNDNGSDNLLVKFFFKPLRF